jgi:hypothetical protein
VGICWVCFFFAKKYVACPCQNSPYNERPPGFSPPTGLHYMGSSRAPARGKPTAPCLFFSLFFPSLPCGTGAPPSLSQRSSAATAAWPLSSATDSAVEPGGTLV